MSRRNRVAPLKLANLGDNPIGIRELFGSNSLLLAAMSAVAGQGKAGQGRCYSGGELAPKSPLDVGAKSRV